jgi:hypothetical protein
MPRRRGDDVRRGHETEVLLGGGNPLQEGAPCCLGLTLVEALERMPSRRRVLIFTGGNY